MIDHALVKRCKPQDVVFDKFTLPILRLRVFIPDAPGSQNVGTEIKVLTRMRETDYFLATTMYPRLPFHLSFVLCV